MSPLLGRRRGTDDAGVEPIDVLFQIGADAIELPVPGERLVEIPDEAPAIISAPPPVAGTAVVFDDEAPNGEEVVGEIFDSVGIPLAADDSVADQTGEESDVDDDEADTVEVPVARSDEFPPLLVMDDAPEPEEGPAADDAAQDTPWYSESTPVVDVGDNELQDLRADLEEELAELRSALASEREVIERLESDLRTMQPGQAPWEQGEEMMGQRREQQLTLLLQRVDALEFARDAVELRLGVLASATEDADGDDVIGRLENRLRDLDQQAGSLDEQRAAVEEMVREFEAHRARWTEDDRAVAQAREGGESAVIALRVHAETAEAHVRGIESELAGSRELTAQVRDLREAVARDHLLITTEKTEAKANVELIHDHCDRAAQAETRAREAAEEAQRAGAQAREHAAEGLQLAERARTRIEDVRELHERLASSFAQHQADQATMREDLRREMQEARESIERVNAESMELRDLTEQARQGHAEAEAARARVEAADTHVAREVARLDEILASATLRAAAAQEAEQQLADAGQQLEQIRRDAESIGADAERCRVDSAQVAQMRSEAERVRSLIDRATEQLEDSARQAGHQREQIDTLSAAAGARMAQLDEEITRLRGDAGRAHGLLAAATSVRDTLDEEIAALRVERDALQAERQDLRDMANAVRADSELWAERVKRASEQVEGLEQELRMARDQISTLVAEQRADSADLREQRLKAAEEIARISAERETAERLVAEMLANAAPVASAPDTAPVASTPDTTGESDSAATTSASAGDAQDGSSAVQELKGAITEAVAAHRDDPARTADLAALRDAAVALAQADAGDVAKRRAAVVQQLAILGVSA